MNSISLLNSSLSRWEWVEYSSAAVVAIAVFGEYIADFTEWIALEWKRRKWRKHCTLVLVAALGFELLALVRTSQLSGHIIAILNKEAGVARDDATQALKLAAQFNDRASSNELASKGLEKQLNETKTQLANAQARLIELQIEQSPLDIGEQSSFSDVLKPMAGMQVELRNVLDVRAETTISFACSKRLKRSESDSLRSSH